MIDGVGPGLLNVQEYVTRYGGKTVMNSSS